MPEETPSVDRPAPKCCGNPDGCTLNTLGVGQSGTVVKVEADRELRRRLMEMGFCAGTEVEVIRRSPFGDPIELKLRGYCLSLRDEQAKCVSVSRSA